MAYRLGLKLWKRKQNATRLSRRNRHQQKEEQNMKTINTVCGKYGVQFIEVENGITAIAIAHDGHSYDGYSYWFTIGHYKTEKGAIRQAVKKMAIVGKELKV